MLIIKFDCTSIRATAGTKIEERLKWFWKTGGVSNIKNKKRKKKKG